MSTALPRPPLDWQHHDGAFWSAYAPSLPSASPGCEGDPTHYLIGVDADGAFCITVDDAVESADCQPSLALAKAWCEARHAQAPHGRRAAHRSHPAPLPAVT